MAHSGDGGLLLDYNPLMVEEWGGSVVVVFVVVIFLVVRRDSWDDFLLDSGGEGRLSGGCRGGRGGRGGLLGRR